MANLQITQLPAAGPITGTELVPIVQGGVTVHTTTAAISASPSQTQTFLTVGLQSTLPNSRYISAGTGLAAADGGSLAPYSLSVTGSLLSFWNSANGILSKTSSTTVAPVVMSASGAGLTVTNGSGISGNPTYSLTGMALSLANQSGNGFLMAAGTAAQIRTLQGTASEITVTDGDGIGGNPTVALASNPVLPGTAGVLVPIGTTLQRPVLPVNGTVRYNSTTAALEGYINSSWRTFSVTGGVTEVDTGTGLLGGPITTTGTISIDNTVVATLTDAQTLTNKTISGTSNTLSNIGNSSLVNSSFTLNGTSVSLGGSAIITAAAPYSLTIGTGLSGTSYNGSAPVTIAIDSTVATLTGVQTLTNKTMSGASNTFSNIPNSALTNSSITIGSTAVSLGGTITTFTGTSISGATNTLSNIGNSSLTNSSVTYNGVTVALGASGTITAATPNALTAGTGLQFNSGTTFDGSAAKTISIDSTVATLTGSQTLTNKTINGPDNTLTNIGNSSLSNSSVTYNGVTVSLGGSGTITANTTNALTFNNGGTGDASGTTFNGSAAKTISYNTLGASPLAGSTSLTTLGTITTGVWNGSAIGNSYLANSSLTIGTTTISLGGTSLTLAGLTSVTVTQDPTSALQLATKQYVDGVAQGLNVKAAVVWGTTANILLTGLTTQAGGEWTGTLTAGDRILVKNQTLPAENGIYAASALGWTRTADADTWNELVSAFVFVEDGATLADTGWVCTVNPGGTLGVTAVTWSQFSGAGTYTAGTGLTLTGNQFSLTVPVTAALGGTGYTSYTAGDMLYATGATALSKLGIGSSGYFISSTGTAPQWSAPAALTKTDDTNVTLTLGGSASTALLNAASLTLGWTGQLATGRGGTGLASYTAGDLLYYASGTALSKLAIGTTNYVLTSSGTAPQYVAQSTLSVGSATNATNTTNTAITANSANATNYLTFVSATTGNLPQLVNSSITCNPSTGQITGGIAGGSF